jgi:hypothetical protein
MAFDYVEFPEVDSYKLLSSLEDTARGLRWPYKKQQVPEGVPGLIKFKFGLGGFCGYNACIKPDIEEGKNYSSMRICTQELVPNEKYKSDIVSFTRLFGAIVKLPKKEPEKISAPDPIATFSKSPADFGEPTVELSEIIENRRSL